MLVPLRLIVSLKNFPIKGGGANGGDTIAVSVSVENDFKGDVLPQASGHV